jgi:hypothetical protein
MIKTINRIRLPEVNSGMRAFPRTSSKFFIDRKGVLRSSAEIRQPVLRMHWRSDAATGRLIAHWGSGEEPGPRSHSFLYFITQRVLLSI